MSNSLTSRYYRGIALPLVDFARRSDSLRAYRELDKSQWWDREAIEELQFRRLKELLVHAGKHVPHYRGQFAQYEFDPAKMQAAADIQRLPFLTKDVIRKEADRLIADNATEFQPRVHRSAGTTGVPIVIQMDRKRHSVPWADMYRWWSAGGWTLGDRQFVVAGAALRPRQLSGIKAKLYSRLNRFEEYTAFDLSTDKLDTLLKRMDMSADPVFIRGYASSIHAVARHAATVGWNGMVKAIFTTAETLFPEQRAQIEAGLHGPVFDQWGCRDGGISAFECDRHRGLHLATENAYVEICREGKPVVNGVSGDVVATDLFSYAMPIIRYQVGDVATFGTEGCTCGRGLPLISSVQGRVSGFLIGSGGKRIHGEYFSHVFWETPWVMEFQIVQNVLDEIVVNIVPLNSPPRDEVDRIRSMMQQQVGPDCHIVIEFPSEIPPGPMGKRQFVISNVPQS